MISVQWFRLGALISAAAALDPHELEHDELVALTQPLHIIGLNFVGRAASAALASGAIFGPILFHTFAAIVLKFDWLILAPGVLTLAAFLQWYKSRSLVT